MHWVLSAFTSSHCPFGMARPQHPQEEQPAVRKVAAVY
jgi:hypothetical protein